MHKLALSKSRIHYISTFQEIGSIIKLLLMIKFYTMIRKL